MDDLHAAFLGSDLTKESSTDSKMDEDDDCNATK
jgi:hypothetical protein